MDVFMNRIEQIPGFKYVIFAAKALIGNFVETGSPSKFDFGPVNTLITSNYVNGVRLRLSGMTTAHLHPHWSFSGYGAYGTRDRKWFYSAQAAYSFNKREYVLWEFPKHYLSFNYTYDVMSPMDKYLATDQGQRVRGLEMGHGRPDVLHARCYLTYELETPTGFSVKAIARNRNDQPAGNLQYWRNDGRDNRARLTVPTRACTTSPRPRWVSTLRYAPGETFVNTKQRRVPVSLDAPVFSLSHTVGLKGVLGGEYNFNLTELSLRQTLLVQFVGKARCHAQGRCAVEQGALPPAQPSYGQPVLHYHRTTSRSASSTTWSS